MILFIRKEKKKKKINITNLQDSRQTSNLEGDSMQTIQAVKDKDCKGLAVNIISGIILEMSKFRMAEVRHISRNGNKIARELA